MKYILAMIIFLSAVATKAVDLPNNERFFPCRLLAPVIRSAVFLCYDNELKTKVVVKLVPKYEIEVMKRANKFKHSIKLLDSFEAPEGSYAIMEYGQGGDLQVFSRSTCRRAAHFAIVRSSFYNAVLAIAELHQNGIAHLDIKPENFFRVTDKEGLTSVKIGDFETAVVLGKRITYRGRRGSLSFIAPEILEGGTYNPLAADIYSTGMMLAAMLVGKPLIKIDKSTPLINTDVLALIKTFQLTEPLPPELADLLEQMTSSDPQKRPTIQEVLDHEWLKGLDAALES